MAKQITDPLISVIVPAYNAVKYLHPCLNSVIHQTYSNLEIIIINDGSTDQTATIIENFQKKDPRIKIISQKNSGLSAARNAGLQKATGDYLTFVDADDTIEPTMLEQLLLALKKYHADISVCSFQETFPNGKTKYFTKQTAIRIYNTNSALQAMLQENGFNVTATMKLFAKSTFNGITFPVGKLHEDVGTTYRAFLKAKTIVFLPKPLYVYHHHTNSIIDYFSDQKFDLITLTDQMCDHIDQSFPDLQNFTNERRMRARFSLLRQIPINHPETKNLLQYLKKHQPFITKNPAASSKDRIALKLALTNLSLFQTIYKLFK